MTPFWVAALLALQGGGPQDLRVQRAVVVQPETVTVGDPFRVVVRIRVSRDAEIGFPDAPDSAGVVEAIDPVHITSAADSLAGGVDQTATYRLAAWDVGRLAIGLGPVRVVAAGSLREVALGDLTVFVRSVLPADTTLHIPKPARDILPVPAPWWWWLLLGLAALALVALVWWWLRRRRAVAARAGSDPYADALKGFARVEALGLVRAGERGRYVALIIEVLREYLSRVIAEADIAHTTAELLASLRGDARVPTNELAITLAEADLIKFARRGVTSDEALRLASEAKQVVEKVHAALLQPPEMRAAA
ncbi:MAG: DUF4381 family protein [Gemmatimonadaceae bacterium]